MSWLAYASAAAVSLGLHQLGFKFMSQYFSPFLGGFIYLCLMVLLFAPLAWWQWQSGERPIWSLPAIGSVVWIAVSGVCFVILYQKAFQLSPSTAMVVVIADVGAVIITTLLATFVLAEPMGMQRALGVGLALGGVFLALKG